MIITTASAQPQTNDAFDQKESKQLLRAAENEISNLHVKAPGLPGLGMGSVSVGQRRPDDDDDNGGDGGGGLQLQEHPLLKDLPEGQPDISSRQKEQQFTEREEQASPELRMQNTHENKHTKTAAINRTPTLAR